MWVKCPSKCKVIYDEYDLNHFEIREKKPFAYFTFQYSVSIAHLRPSHTEGKTGCRPPTTTKTGRTLSVTGLLIALRVCQPSISFTYHRH